MKTLKKYYIFLIMGICCISLQLLTTCTQVEPIEYSNPIDPENPEFVMPEAG